MIEGVHGLEGTRVLIVEDECVIAMELEYTLKECGAEVIGSCMSVESALAKLQQSRDLDVAILDIDLRGQYAGPIADQLRMTGIPFIVTSGYEARRYTIKFKGVPWFEKPVNPQRIAAAIVDVRRQRNLFPNTGVVASS
jgi:two-component SAPR family response regulator